MMPANWQAQWIVAACQRFCRSGHEVITRLEAERVEGGNQRGNPPVPLAVGQAQIAVDDRERTGIARHARQKAGSEIKHWTWSIPVVMPLSRKFGAAAKRVGSTGGAHAA